MRRPNEVDDFKVSGKTRFKSSMTSAFCGNGSAPI